MRVGLVVVGMLAASSTCFAQEQEDAASSFSRIKGGAIFDYKEGVDGTAISEEYLLTHVVCSAGSRTLRVMLPVAPDDDGISFSIDGEKSTLKKQGNNYQVTIKVGGKRILKPLELKPVNDKKSHNPEQFVLKLEYGDALWTAMTSKEPGRAVILIGTGGTPISLPDDRKLTEALKSCGLPG